MDTKSAMPLLSLNERAAPLKRRRARVNRKSQLASFTFSDAYISLRKFIPRDVIGFVSLFWVTVFAVCLPLMIDKRKLTDTGESLGHALSAGTICGTFLFHVWPAVLDEHSHHHELIEDDSKHMENCHHMRESGVVKGGHHMTLAHAGGNVEHGDHHHHHHHDEKLHNTHQDLDCAQDCLPVPQLPEEYHPVDEGPGHVHPDSIHAKRESSNGSLKMAGVRHEHGITPFNSRGTTSIQPSLLSVYNIRSGKLPEVFFSRATWNLVLMFAGYIMMQHWFHDHSNCSHGHEAESKANVAGGFLPLFTAKRVWDCFFYYVPDTLTEGMMFMVDRNDREYNVFMVSLGTHKFIESVLVIGMKLYRTPNMTPLEHFLYAVCYAALVPLGYLFSWLVYTFLPKKVTFFIESFFIGLTGGFFLWTIKAELLPDVFKYIWDLDESQICPFEHDERGCCIKPSGHCDHGDGHCHGHSHSHGHGAHTPKPCLKPRQPYNFSGSMKVLLVSILFSVTLVMQPIFIIIDNLEHNRPYSFLLYEKVLDQWMSKIYWVCTHFQEIFLRKL